MGTIHCTLKELAAGIKVPLDARTTLIVGPDAAVATLAGRAFDAGKSFPLSRAVAALQQVFAFAVSLVKPKAALVVGHTNDGQDAEALSTERAEMLAAWLKGDPEPWLSQYTESVEEAKRWGAREDRVMLLLIPGLQPSPKGPSAPSPNAPAGTKPRDETVRAYQAARGLQTDGIAGPITRKALIKDYFALTRNSSAATDADAATAAEPKLLELDITAHGAAANFSLDDVVRARAEASGAAETEADAADPDAADPEDAPAATSVTANERLDFFFFFSQAGISPAPAAADGEEYLEWIRLASIDRLFTTGGSGSASAAQLSMQLFDRSGTILHVGQHYTISGPEEFAGVTDAQGRLDHDDVLPGDYELTLNLRFLEGKHAIEDQQRSPIVVQGGSAAAQVRRLGAVPRCNLARLNGMLFDTNKAFLLPSALPDLKELRAVYSANSPSKLLVVGHTDTTGTPAANDTLSLERAKSTLAYLQDDVDAWLKFYTTSTQQSRRWGAVEDMHMLSAVLGEPPDESLLGIFQSLNDIDETVPGEQTRRLLISKYMGLDRVELDSGEFPIEATAHGCGEYFPLDEAGAELDATAEDEKEDPLDRRVELFFFDTEFGIVPPAPGANSAKGSTEYPEWRRLAKLTSELTTTGPEPPLNLFVYDELRQLMPDAPYRIKLDDGTTRAGQADSEGLIVVHGLGRQRSLTLQWGHRVLDEDAGEDPDQEVEIVNADEVTQPLPEDDDAARSFYAFALTLDLTRVPADRRIETILGNLGHVGEEPERRRGFEEFYLSSDDDTIEQVYQQGRSA